MCGMKGTVLECEINFKLLGKYEKGKTVTVHAMKACMESRVTTAFILNARHQMEVGGQIHVQADLPPGIHATRATGRQVGPRAGLEVLQKRKVSSSRPDCPIHAISTPTLRKFCNFK